ncbi:uncharacterized protein METZ01_LOCUS234861 [marine metagenome]|uniref:Uncharacterized protein n=1 Tax=marine metagenome TaxID=408172 RepID=A0A382H507_9ZZZZ
MTDFVVLVVYGIAMAPDTFRDHPQARILMLIYYAEQGRADLNLDVPIQSELMEILLSMN